MKDLVFNYTPLGKYESCSKQTCSRPWGCDDNLFAYSELMYK